MEESGEYLAYCMIMIWFCMANQKNLKTVVQELRKVCKRRCLKTNVNKSKVTVESEENTRCWIMLGGEQLKQVSLSN